MPTTQPSTLTKGHAATLAVELIIRLLELELDQHGHTTEARKNCYTLSKLVAYMQEKGVNQLAIDEIKTYCLDPLVLQDLKNLVELDLGSFNDIKDFLTITVTQVGDEVNICVERRPLDIIRRFFRWIRSWF